MSNLDVNSAHRSALEKNVSARRLATGIRIEKAALQLFLERGVENVTSDEIADQAGISRRTFYRYFERPVDVLKAIPGRSLQKMAKDIRRRPPNESVLEALVQSMRNAEFTEEELELTALAFKVMRKSPEAWEAAMAQTLPRTTEMYQSMFARRLRLSGGEVEMAGVVAAGVAAIMFRICVERFRRGKPPSVDDFERGLRGFSRAVSTARAKGG